MTIMTLMKVLSHDRKEKFYFLDSQNRPFQWLFLFSVPSFQFNKLTYDVIKPSHEGNTEWSNRPKIRVHFPLSSLANFNDDHRLFRTYRQASKQPVKAVSVLRIHLITKFLKLILKRVRLPKIRKFFFLWAKTSCLKATQRHAVSKYWIQTSSGLTEERIWIISLFFVHVLLLFTLFSGKFIYCFRILKFDPHLRKQPLPNYFNQESKNCSKLTLGARGFPSQEEFRDWS